MIIEVTIQHLKKGIPKSSSHCPVALAFKDSGFEKIQVETFEAWIDGKRVELPFEAIDFIEAFDEKQITSPFSFNVEYFNSHH